MTYHRKYNPPDPVTKTLTDAELNEVHGLLWSCIHRLRERRGWQKAAKQLELVSERLLRVSDKRQRRRGRP